jgi:hypothetical protein
MNIPTTECLSNTFLLLLYLFSSGISSTADDIVMEYAESITMANPITSSQKRNSTGIFIWTSKLKLGTDYY